VSAASAITERIHRNGPVRFGTFVELALYGAGGFFTEGGGAGRSGRDFVTSPEVGPLFGTCVARALDAEWARQDRPDPFVVVEAGAGNGRLASDVLRAAPACAPALHYVLVERSARLRAEQATRLSLEPVADALGPAARVESEDSPVPVGGLGPIVGALDDLPAREVDGVILANELLDNLAFEIVVRTEAGWDEVRVANGDHDDYVELRVPAAEDLTAWVRDVDVPVGTRLPVATQAVEWLARAASCLHRGALLLVDYTAEWDALAERAGGWLRTYAAHERGSEPLVTPGSRDITADVPIAMVRRAAARAGLTAAGEYTQAGWLAALGIDDLVIEGRARWEAAAAAPDLAAIAGRSRGTEAAALTDPLGLGAHTVVTLTRP
jgi:NADH dehydrogenase [ubiquinone] 1 alpha subcomplex assembly factor 7